MTNPCNYVLPLQLLSAIVAIMAAVFWFRASVKKVPNEFNQDRLKELNGDILAVLSDQSVAMARQGKLNAWAAFFAGCAAILQIPIAFLPTCWG
jgi:hypothetical protein